MNKPIPFDLGSVSSYHKHLAHVDALITKSRYAELTSDDFSLIRTLIFHERIRVEDMQAHIEANR